LAFCDFSGSFQVDTTTGTVESSGLDINFPGLTVFDTLTFSGPLGMPPFWQIQVGNSDMLQLY
jgi:hypothetical protein